MIRSFFGEDTERLFRGRHARKLPPDIQRVPQQKLRQIHAAEELRDLAVPLGNRLEALKRDRLGQHRRRINDPWRVGFIWTDGGADLVEITDYH